MADGLLSVTYLPCVGGPCLLQVVDLKRFSPGRELEPGLLWVVEQAPGLVVASDATESLVRGYWPSYNVRTSLGGRLLEGVVWSGV